MSKTVADYMDPIEIVTLDTPCSEIITLMRNKNTRIVAVCGVNMRIKGIITLSDILKQLANDIRSENLIKGLAEDIMTDYDHIVCVREDMIMLQALREMTTNGVHSLVVTKGFQPTGVLHQSHFIRWWQDEVIATDS